MKHIASHLPPASTDSTKRITSEQPEEETEAQKSELCLAWLFREFAAEFRGKWAAEMQTQEAIRSTKASWWPQVRDLTRTEILAGLAAMPVGDGAWPPGPRAFRKLCRPDDARPSCEAHRLYLPTPPRSRESREAARAQIEAIRAKLPTIETPEQPVVLPADIPSLADRRAFITRHADALRAIGFAELVGSGTEEAK
jgi:hypothetical protein